MEQEFIVEYGGGAFLNRRSFYQKQSKKIFYEILPFYQGVAMAVTLFVMVLYRQRVFGGYWPLGLYMAGYVLFAGIMISIPKHGELMKKHPFVMQVVHMCLVLMMVIAEGKKGYIGYLLYIVMIIFHAYTRSIQKALLDGMLCALSYSGILYTLQGVIAEEILYRSAFIVLVSLCVSVVSQSVYKHAYHMAICDSVTSLYNNQFFNDSLKLHSGQATRRNKKLSVILLDIDNFKKYNDQYGHLEGDRMLKKVSLIIKDNIRASDIASRYGGDEFAIVLPNTDSAAAACICERIRSKAYEAFSGKISVSIGIATLPIDGCTDEELFKAADSAMYQSKGLGKNMVSLFQEIPKKPAVFSQ